MLRPAKPAARKPATQQSAAAGVGAGILRNGRERTESKEEEDDDEEQEEGAEDSGMIPASLSRKIMRQAQSQQREEEEAEDEDDEDDGQYSTSSRQHSKQHPSFRLRDDTDTTAANDEDDDDDEAEEQSVLADDEEVEELELSPEDETALARFLPTSLPTRRNLAELILAKLDQHTASAASSAAQPARPPLDPKVLAVYQQVGVYLSHYTSGKVPKAFKIVPSLRNWEEVLALTSPDKWTPAAVSAATRLFASGLNERMAQRYYSLVILPRVRRDIAEHSKLNYHLYQSLRRALFKPAAFFRGLVLPLASGECDDGDMTLREAVILSSVLAKYSVPPLHAAACMLRLLEMPYSGPVMLLILTLINKRYSLPVRVVDALSIWFGEGGREGGVGEGGKVRMPVVWHKGLLCFVQRYGAEMNDEQVRRIREVTRVQVHSGMTKEVRRELMRVKEKKAAEKSQAGIGGTSASVVNTPASAISVLSAGRITPSAMEL